MPRHVAWIFQPPGLERNFLLTECELVHVTRVLDLTLVTLAQLLQSVTATCHGTYRGRTVEARQISHGYQKT